MCAKDWHTPLNFKETAMSFKPFKVDSSFFVVVAENDDGKLVLQGQTGTLENELESKVKLGQIVYVEKKDDTWTISKVEKPVKKSTKGNPVFTPEQQKRFDELNA